ncbi:flagellar basal body-associated FliL family protein [Pseudoduganella sp. SL102]|uniref:flagellar basal body-associated FliL family protein n=1 Tax=Pseudoduganella sp. SL102 TaxID=2995154 RepID=UPI00248C3DCA|nr:flagellar basal body-associated FliL family protein [Pseudoduganella sp. SL102]WBS00824.1 flagellar basal body-associated FliL family protein [Pseudoduganella sp. SL102]
MNKKLIMIILGVALVCGGGAGAAVWFLAPKADAAEAAHGEDKTAKKKKKKEDEEEVGPLKYLTVDKVIVMLRRSPNEAVPHYLSADLVVATPVKLEKEAKEHLPLLRSVAVRTLSGLPMDKAQAMTIDEYAEALNKAFEAEYEKDEREQPFKEVMIGKLILE